MALALAAREDLQLHIAHDERAAAFIALGIGLSTRVPAALLCTSGTAATHFHAAVVEADLSSVPLLALTADRPPELQGIGAPQTINQARLFGDVVRCYADAGVADEGKSSTWRGLAAEWWSRAADGNPGPVHVNLPFREPLVGVVGELPASVERADVSTTTSDPREIDRLVAALDARRGVIVAGGRVDDPAAVELLADNLRWPVLADARSGCRSLARAVNCFDAILRNDHFGVTHRPEVVLHLGEPPASKVLGRWLQSFKAFHVHVNASPRVIDPLRVVNVRVVGSPSDICRQLAKRARPPATDCESEWLQAENLGQEAIDSALKSMQLCEPMVARILSDIDAQLVVASSMPIRDVEWFGRAGSTTKVFSNRGANGIDGVIATAIGVAIGSGQRTVALLGDVAFCHDQSSLTALASRRLPLKLVVVDNDGGGIFSFLPQATTLPTERFEQLFGTPHGTDIVAVAEAHHLGACSVTTADEFRAALADPTVSVVRVPTDRARNVEDHNRINTAVAAAIS